MKDQLTKIQQQEYLDRLPSLEKLLKNVQSAMQVSVISNIEDALLELRDEIETLYDEITGDDYDYEDDEDFEEE